jgi:hypothetical protein
MSNPEFEMAEWRSGGSAAKPGDVASILPKSAEAAYAESRYLQ